MLYLAPSLLVVDDDALLRTCLSEMFIEAGYAVRNASDGFSALAAIRDEIPDLLLSDLNMPGMSGFELLSIVRRRFPFIRVVAMSSGFAGGSLPSGIAADAFYQKGTDPIFLLRIVEGIARPGQSLASRRTRSWRLSGFHPTAAMLPEKCSLPSPVLSASELFLRFSTRAP